MTELNPGVIKRGPNEIIGRLTKGSGPEISVERSGVGLTKNISCGIVNEIMISF